MLLLISKLTVIMFILVPLVETQKHSKMYRQSCQSAIVKLAEVAVDMKPNAASEKITR